MCRIIHVDFDPTEDDQLWIVGPDQELVVDITFAKDGGRAVGFIQDHVEEQDDTEYHEG